MRVVIDTNLWLSGLMLPNSVPGHIVRSASMTQIVAVMSEAMLQGLRLALHYRRIRPRIALSDEELERYLAELHYIAEIVDIAGSTARVPRDRRDDIVLATYLVSGADYLLTGDDDLLSLRPDYAILTAREFYDQHLR
jgi:putative PIN family toxin of toxin-antitoxin system